MGIARDGCCPEIRKNGRHISKPHSSVVVFLHALSVPVSCGTRGFGKNPFYLSECKFQLLQVSPPTV
ncbi:unnamed protein product, partial [Sphagnum troendelagicum]